MEKLTENILNIFGKEGEKWLANLPAIIETLAHHWKLSNINPVNNLTF